MRLVDVSRLILPAGWQERARAALEAIAALDSAERAKAINQRSAIWAELKPALKGLSHNKCWYCESKDLRSDNAVDHFRPKNSVKGTERFPAASGHPGYWWLAFDYTNYRFSCTICNSIRKSAGGTSGGKQDCFPLFDEQHRAKCDHDDTDEELPLLLDPTNPADLGALWFDDSGTAVPRPKKPGESDVSYERWRARAEESIALYHLNHPDIKEARHRLAQQIRQLANDTDKWLRRAESGVPVAHAELGVKLGQLRRALDADSEYSATGYCVLRGLRGSSPAAEAVLELF
jgi:hypothetical protein